MNTNNTFAGIVIVALLLGACVPQSTPTPTSMVPVTGAIGRISVEETLVESGPSDSLIQVTKTEDFFDNYAVRVTNGGVAKLDFFVDQISIRLFNDTAVGDVKADPSGTPDRAVRMKLVFGGLSGEVAKNGIPVKFEITNGVNIYILGTQFLVLYDPETRTTYIGNFDGTIAYTIPGQQATQFIQPGQIYEISQNFETTKFTLNFTRTDIENLTSNKRSTLLDTLKDYLEPTSTPTPTTTPTPSPTSSPTITSTLTPSPTLAPTITPTRTKILACDQAAFVADVTIPDGTSFSPGFQFTKVWRLKNVGTCTWTTSYSLVFYKGEQMSGPTSVNVPSTVAPGQTVDIAVGLVAPRLPGSYRGEWILHNSSGTLFGVGADGTTPIWVTINVISTGTITPVTPVALPDLIVRISSGTTVNCPGGSGTCVVGVNFVIMNISNVAVTDTFEILVEAEAVPSQTIIMNGLAAGASQSFSEKLGPGNNCFNPDCTVRVTVDSSNIIRESNEANNVAEQTTIG